MEATNSPKSVRPPKQRIGEQFVQGGLINEEQLEQVLRRQSQVGGQLGSLLIEMGFVAINDLLEYLSKKFGVPAENLFSRSIDAQTLKLIPVDKMESKKIMPVADDGTTLTLAMVNPQDFAAISEIEFQVGKKVRPVVAPAFMMAAALKNLKTGSGEGLHGTTLAELVAMERGDESPQLTSLLRYLVKTNASDMILCAGAPPSIKKGNALKRLALPHLTPSDCEKYARDLLPPNAWDTFLKEGDYGFGATYRGIGRFRVTIFQQRQSVAIALRPISDQIPSLTDLQLPAWLSEFALRPHGLIVVCGPAGHGKSTTLAVMVNIINSNRGCNIITLEDPIEYLFKHKSSNICQREIGRDTQSFFEGIRHVFRQAPDVIVVGELRDKETFRIALQAANSGHLVLSTAHAENTTAIIERTINMFEPHEQNHIRMMLSDSLILSIYQCLVPLANGSGRVPAIEKFINSHRLRKFIREGKTHQIRSQLQSGAEDFTSIDIALAELHKKNLIAFEQGLVYAEDRQFYQELIQMTGARKQTS
ncbi:MAG: PilT/PilU family type 4a pilus ATPase [Desulfobacteraceae bacterium]|nr:PilT/PilU family type 4a pilus ATPase [Desulfobacteraceae bacterium]